MIEDKNKNKVLKSALLFFSVMLLGVIGYMVIEGWNAVDSIFMTIITLGTIGYGETHDLSQAGRIFTIFLIVFGLGSAASVLNSFATLLLDNKLNHFLGRKAMDSELKKIKDHVILCGLGQIGMIIALKLQEKNIPFVVIEHDQGEIDKMQQLGFAAVHGDVTLDGSLHAAGIKRAKTLVICVTDLTVNLTLSLAAKEINPQIEVIAQGVDRAFESRMTRAGADKIVYPLALGGEQISELIAHGFKANVEIAGTAESVNGYTLKVHRHFDSISTTLHDILEKEQGLRVIALNRANGELIDNPNLELEVNNGDNVIILLNPLMKSIIKETFSHQKIVYRKILWSDDYSVGDPLIDNEHLQLIQLINVFNEAVHSGESQKILSYTFDRLISYSLEHFKNEEEKLKECQYPDLENHILEHQRLIKTVLDLNKEKKYVFPENISDFLNHWLIDHIMDCDQKYKNYIS